MSGAARMIIAAGLLLAAAGCATAPSGGGAAIATASDGKVHSEPVIYNGQRFKVTFQYKGERSGYDVWISRRGRALSGAGGDKEKALHVATSALSHYACPQGQKAKPVDDTSAFAGGTWRLMARCA